MLTRMTQAESRKALVKLGLFFLSLSFASVITLKTAQASLLKDERHKGLDLSHVSPLSQNQPRLANNQRSPDTSAPSQDQKYHLAVLLCVDTTYHGGIMW